MARRLRSIKGEGTVRRRPDGRYEGRVWLNDGRRISVYGATQREVTRQVRELKAQDESGKPIVRNQERVSTFLTNWLENEIKRRRRAKFRCRTVWTSEERAPSVVPKLSLANGLVYCRSHEGELACFDLRAARAKGHG